MPSTAHITTAMPGDQARSIIAERWPDVARRLRSAPPFRQLELDTAGPVQTLSARGIRLASAWQPDAEAELQVAHLRRVNDAVTLYGVGMGGLPELLLQRLSPYGKLEVVLLNTSLFGTMLDVVEQSTWLRHPAVKLTLASEHGEVAARHAITTPLLTLAEPAAERLRDRLLQTLTADHASDHLATRETLTRDNMRANETTVAADPDVAMLFSRTCETAVVVAAGPSLDRSTERIGQLRRQGARVICVDAALQPLLNAGTQPDCVVTLDPQAAVRRFFDVDIAALKTTSLVYFPQAHPDVLQLWPHERYVAYTTHSRYASLRERVAHTSLFTSGSVIHPATDLAVRMGAKTLYLAGADFGFPFNGTHASASAFCRAAPVDNAAGVTVRSYDDRPIASQVSFVSYYRDLEAFIGSELCERCRFINIGQYSARIAGVTHEALA